MDRAGRRWAHRWLGIAALAVALGACSASDTAGPGAEAPPPTTTVATTTTSSPTTTEDPEVAAVRDAHLAFLEMFELVGDPPDPDHPELARRATGDAYDRLRANLTQDRLAGNTLTGGWDSSIRSIEVRGDTAVVTDCLLDAGQVRDADGVVIVEADQEPSLQTTELVREEGTWRVARLNVPEERIPCGA